MTEFTTSPVRSAAHLRTTLLVTALLIAAGSGLMVLSPAAEVAHMVPAPAVEEQAGAQASEVAVLAGGCFWGVQGVFQHVNGVTAAVSGYAGGDKTTAQYEMVGTGTPVTPNRSRITSIPARSRTAHLQIFFSVAHDPTQLNRQGPDFGPPVSLGDLSDNAEQARVAKAYIAQLDQAHVFSPPSSPRSSRIEILCGRGLPSGLPDAHPGHPYIVYQRPAQDREPEAALPRDVSP